MFRITEIQLTIICEFDVSLVVQQHVVELEVPVDDPALVQVVQRQADLSRVEPNHISVNA